MNGQFVQVIAGGGGGGLKFFRGIYNRNYTSALCYGKAAKHV